MTTDNIVQAGGVLAFASLVLYILRELRPVLKGIGDVIEGFRAELFELRITLAALLERERIRDQRRQRETSSPPALRAVPSPAVVPTGEFDAPETTDIATLIEQQRTIALASPGDRPPRPGTHHDKGR